MVRRSNYGVPTVPMTSGPSRAAMFTRSANESAFILRITLPRWAFTVISLMPRVLPTCLFNMPDTTSTKDVSLASTERLVAFAQRGQLSLLRQGGLAPRQRLANGAEQDLVVEGLGEELDGARLHGLNRHRDVAMPGDEDDRHVEPVCCELLLEVEPVLTREADVEHQAAWHSGPLTTQELLGGLERLYLQTDALEEQLQRLSHREVVVDDEHDGRLKWHRWRVKFVSMGVHGCSVRSASESRLRMLPERSKRP